MGTHKKPPCIFDSCPECAHVPVDGRVGGELLCRLVCLDSCLNGRGDVPSSSFFLHILCLYGMNRGVVPSCFLFLHLRLYGRGVRFRAERERDCTLVAAYTFGAAYVRVRTPFLFFNAVSIWEREKSHVA